MNAGISLPKSLAEAAQPLGDNQQGDGLWVAVNIEVGSTNTDIVVDLHPLAGVPPLAVRYAWGNGNSPNGQDVQCCQDWAGPSNWISKAEQHECVPASCPIMLSYTGVVFGG
eukprot:CAMPEP_0175177196 /NCGR_PEP_ID=MMETSP0087-20121206/34245_1 /TAXON_ID=136419 /ORGANISM="Unknown Unknown, Strain D1" /LENGTH=111 /DNA_ID=CAMNT_0016469133 /DNA_START=221 /DNA_END=552 /DNA_ORIENTATION=+